MMSYKLGIFTPYARSTLINSHRTAFEFHNDTITPEHLLFNLVREGDSMACYVFAELGIDLEQFNVASIAALGRAEDRPPMRSHNVSEQVKQVMAFAVDEAKVMGHHRLSTAHILLGILRIGEGRAYAALQQLGVNLEDTRRLTHLAIE
jgi:ATP-dependent Clp protease ATP-binding subunit ClpC